MLSNSQKQGKVRNAINDVINYPTEIFGRILFLFFHFQEQQSTSKDLKDVVLRIQIRKRLENEYKKRFKFIQNHSDAPRLGGEVKARENVRMVIGKQKPAESKHKAFALTNGPRYAEYLHRDVIKDK